MGGGAADLPAGRLAADLAATAWVFGFGAVAGFAATFGLATDFTAAVLGFAAAFGLAAGFALLAGFGLAAERVGVLADFAIALGRAGALGLVAALPLVAARDLLCALARAVAFMQVCSHFRRVVLRRPRPPRGRRRGRATIVTHHARPGPTPAICLKQ
ncbi:hypothetical protein ROS9278_05158 [Roseomonas sp. CECT 9278]|nr:hypothetical protein ROS9278_05158 [Roseomonas sp. CECT 9278]